VTCDLEPATADRVFRVCKGPDPWAYPDWAQAGEDGTFGNRWDDPKSAYRVLYACSQRLGALIETLSRFRPDPEVLTGLAAIEGEDDEGVLPPGHVPTSWFTARLMGEATLTGRFADVAHGRSLAYLRGALAARVVHYGLDDLDGAAIRSSAPRRFTHEVSRFIYDCTAAGQQQFAGIRYASRLGDEFENWAVFEPGRPAEDQTRQIRTDDPDVVAAFDRLDLTLVAGGESHG
jgi:hypothetical protein